MKLGTLIETLESLPGDAVVRLDDGRAANLFYSWRGVYAELTLDGEGEPITVDELLHLARAADGATFQGYKGGDYVMDRSTPVWADPYGACGHRGLMGATLHDGTVTLMTADLSDYRGW